jgi:beta-barrel assembly-enhancing protease
LTPRRLARELGILFGVLLSLAAVAFAVQRLFFPAPRASPDVPRELDDALGPLVRQQVRASQKVIEEPLVTAGFSRIMARLIPALPGGGAAGPRIDVLVVDSADVNAFTLPGGLICVDTGLIRALPSAEEMAAVLGHELSHAVSRDPLALMARQLGLATLLNAVSGGQGGAVMESMVREMVTVRYGREAEDRADAFSVDLLARAGIEPQSFARALAHIHDASPKRPDLLKYLDPHSPIDRRVARAEEQARKEKAAVRPLAVKWRTLVQALPDK